MTTQTARLAAAPKHLRRPVQGRLLTHEQAIDVATKSIIENCPEFSSSECEHIAYRVIEALKIAHLERGGSTEKTIIEFRKTLRGMKASS